MCNATIPLLGTFEAYTERKLSATDTSFQVLII
jgi:hypothetical protein